MSPQRILGIVLLVAGLIFLTIGMNASHSAADQVSSTFTGRFTGHTTWYMAGGGAPALFELPMLGTDARGNNA
jgi:hypothetical protein